MPSSSRSPLDRATRALRSVRRAVLARRRLLAALLTAVAVATGLHAAAAPPPASVAVTVAARDLPAGTVLGADDLTRRAFAPDSVPDDLVAAPTGRALAGPLRRGEPVTDVRLVGPALTEGHPELTAVPLRLPDAGMVDLLRVGDRVDLVAADPQGGTADVVAVGVSVLAIPRDDSEQTATGLAGRLVVVGAAPADVPRIAASAVTHFMTFAFSR
jgi:Flp pilus assembly protein CpaB